MASSWPVNTDVATWLSQRSLAAVDSTAATSALAEVEAMFKSVIGYWPFFNSTGSALSVRYFDPPRQSCHGWVLALDAPLTGIGAGEIKAYYDPLNTSAALTLTRYTDWDYKDRNEDYQTHIVFKQNYGFDPQSIRINGVWGRPDIPDDVYYAVLKMAAGVLLFETTAGKAGIALGVTKVKQGPVEFNYGTSEGSFWKMVAENFQKVCGRYQWVAD